MTALEFLSQAYLLEQQVQTKLQQVSLLRSLIGSLKTYSREEPVTHTKNVSALQDAVVKVLEEEEELNREIDRLVDVKREIRAVLSEVKDLNLRLVLEKRHLCYESWPRIGEEMGYTDRWALVRHKMGLVVVEKILERREREGGFGHGLD